jgi:hypothetical protein
VGGREDEEEDVSSYWIMEIERGSSRSHSLENSIWKKLWTCRKTNYRMNVGLEIQEEKCID